MKNPAFAFVILLIGGVIVFVVLSFFGVGTATAISIAAIPFAGITYVDQLLEKKQIKPTISALPKGIVRLEVFALRWYLMIVYATLILAAVWQFGGFIGVLIAWLQVIPEEFVDIPIAVASMLMAVGCVYLLGVWIGTRCDKLGILTIIAVTFFGSALSLSLDFLVLSGPEFQQFYGAPKTVGLFLNITLLDTLLMGIFGMIGFWRGRRARLSRYVWHLLSRLPADSRNTLVDLVNEEAQRLSSD